MFRSTALADIATSLKLRWRNSTLVALNIKLQRDWRPWNMPVHDLRERDPKTIQYLLSDLNWMNSSELRRGTLRQDANVRGFWDRDLKIFLTPPWDPVCGIGKQICISLFSNGFSLSDILATNLSRGCYAMRFACIASFTNPMRSDCILYASLIFIKEKSADIYIYIYIYIYIFNK